MISQNQFNKFNKTFTHPVSVVTTYTLEKRKKKNLSIISSSKVISQIMKLKLAAILVHFMHEFYLLSFWTRFTLKNKIWTKHLKSIQNIIHA